ncbi:MAG: c-type cytochrome [Campylobacterales bacterium]|nr:c-type cytochrome [Campylobacterales bacterium]
MKKSILVFVALLGLASVSVMADEGADLYKKCAVCHGAQGEKAALGKSKIIKDLGVSGVITALKGYKDGTYGGPSKAVMKGQASPLTDAQISAIASYIAK